MIISATGHRPDKLGGYKLPNPIYTSVCQQVKQLFVSLNPEKVISGMALGFDQYFANVAVQLNIPLIAAVPFVGQESVWSIQDQKRYNKLLKSAAEVIIVSPGSYSADKMHIRNKYLVDNCDLLIAAWDGTPGGTGSCINYAKSQNRKITFLNLKD